MTLTNLLVAVCGVACGALLAFERSSSSQGIKAAKPIAAAAFVGVALSLDGAASSYGRLIVLGLCLSMVGDILLITAEVNRRFLVGIVSFLLAHIVYSVAFGFRAFVPSVFWIVAAIVSILSVIVYLWLRAHLVGPFRLAVPVYIVVIAFMVAMAGSAAVGSGEWLIAIGAAMFFVSDLFVARDRFVQADSVNKMLGLPLYFGGQILIALTVASVASSMP